MLTIPLPKMPPLVIAAVARGSKDSSDSLMDMHRRIIALLDEHDIHPVSLASDGTDVERQTQAKITAAAPKILPFTIRNSHKGCQINLEIPLHNGTWPFVIVQDSKHALKTARNNLFTGARILVLGHFAAFFSQLRDLAANALSPLFVRDVEKVDRQDDRAAARLFSADSISFHSKNYKDQPALSVYLFVLGELVDAWQDRSISHVDRARMVLRARFFSMAWYTHVTLHPEYSVNVQFISRQSYDIFLTLCDSLLSLIIVYRRFYPTYPLLPWLHSTEVCEHVFGIIRQLKKDFNYPDFLHLVRKLRVLLMGALSYLSPEEKADQTASGYHHTYFQTNDLDLLALMQYPSQEELDAASTWAYDEAKQLLSTLGIDADEMLPKYQPPCHDIFADQPKPPSFLLRLPNTIFEILTLYQSAPKTQKQGVAIARVALS